MKPIGVFILLFSVFKLCSGNCTAPCRNITVGIILEGATPGSTPLSFAVNRTIGIIELAKIRAREMTKDLANLDFIIRYTGVSTCVARDWGAMAAEAYHNFNVNAIIGPGRCKTSRFRPRYFEVPT